MSRKDNPQTPDGRYFVARGRLWRKTDPSLDDATRRTHIKVMMQARRALQTAQTGDELRAARDRVDAAKHALGERGPVWWTDGSPDEGGKHPRDSSYAAWWAGLTAQERENGA